MKIAKFIITLQVIFLTSVFIFSASAVYQPAQVDPLAITNLAVRQQGYELASPEKLEMYQALLSNLDGMARAAEALKAGQIPDNAEVLDIPGADSPVYLVSLLDAIDKIQFLVVMARSDESGKIAAVIEKNEQLSEQLGIFVGLPPTQSIENVIADTQKASSAGMDQLATEFKAAKLKLETLQKQLEIENIIMDNARLPDTYNEASAVAIKLKKAIDTAQSKLTSLQNTITMLTASTNKASSAGMNQLNQFVIEFEDAEFELETLQKQLAAEKNIMDNATSPDTYNEAALKAAMLRKTVYLTQSKIADIQNIITMFTASTNKASSAGMDQADMFALQFKDAELELVTLRDKLVTAKINEQDAYTVMLDAINSGNIDEVEKRSDDYDNVITEVVELEKDIYVAQFKIDNMQNVMARIRFVASTPTSKASSAGYEKDAANVMAYFSGAARIFTNASTIPLLDIDMLSRQVEVHKKAINKLESIKIQSPDAAIAVAEHLKLVQASLDTMIAVQSIVAEDAALKNVTGTIVINDNDIPNNQQVLLTMLDKANPYLEVLETKLGCKVRLLSQYNHKSDGAANMIAISSMSVGGISRRVDINSIIEDGYLPLEEVIVFAKGLLTYNQDTRSVLDGTIAQMYRFITKTPISPKLLEAFLRNSVFVLDLPIPLAIDEAYYEQLHRQALAALIAA